MQTLPGGGGSGGCSKQAGNLGGTGKQKVVQLADRRRERNEMDLKGNSLEGAGRSYRAQKINIDGGAQSGFLAGMGF